MILPVFTVIFLHSSRSHSKRPCNKASLKSMHCCTGSQYKPFIQETDANNAVNK